MSARDEILTALAGRPKSSAPLERSKNARVFASSGSLFAVQQFAALAEENGCRVEIVRGPDALRLSLMAFLTESGAKQVWSWPEFVLPVPGLFDALKMINIDVVELTGSPLSIRPLLTQDVAPLCGITSAVAGVVETGSLIIRYDVQLSPLVHLWPMTHIVLLRASDLFDSMSTWLHHASRTNLLSAATRSEISVLTGNNRVVDVQGDPVIGMYGALQLRVYIVEDEYTL